MWRLKWGCTVIWWAIESPCTLLIKATTDYHRWDDGDDDDQKFDWNEDDDDQMFGEDENDDPMFGEDEDYQMFDENEKK